MDRGPFRDGHGDLVREEVQAYICVNADHSGTGSGGGKDKKVPVGDCLEGDRAETGEKPGVFDLLLQDGSVLGIVEVHADAGPFQTDGRIPADGHEIPIACGKRLDLISGDERRIPEPGLNRLLDVRDAAVDQNARRSCAGSAKKHVHQKGPVLILDGKIPAVHGRRRDEILPGMHRKSRKILRKVIFQCRFLYLGERHAVLDRTRFRQSARFFNGQENVVVRLKPGVGNIHDRRRADVRVGSGDPHRSRSPACCRHGNGNELTVRLRIQVKISKCCRKQRAV